MKDINNCKQNHPELIIGDLKQYIPDDILRDVLKFRGVNKWLRVRRLLIQLKSKWREDVKELENEKHIAKEVSDFKRYYNIQGQVEAIIDCRQQLRALCHSPRDIDFPHNKHDFGLICKLPDNFPQRPHKRWFYKNKEV